MRILPAASVATTLLLTPALAFAAPAAAAPVALGGSDSPVPYTVSAQGLTLPNGDVFRNNGHVNIKYTVGGAQKSANIHFETQNNQPSGKYVGKKYLPWSALIRDASYCITWVQVSHYNEHFGEGGQKPVCTGDKPAPEPSSPGKPVPTPSKTSPVPGKPSSPEAPNDTPSAPSPVPSEVLSPVPSVTPSPVPSEAPVDETKGEEVESGGKLAVTGFMVVPVVVLAVLLVAAGAVLLVVSRRRVKRG